MAHPFPVAGSDARFRGILSAGDVVLLSVLALCLTWVIYVFADSQLAYVCATAASAALAVRLAAMRSQALVVMLLAELGLLGPQANGELASGTPLLGSFRLLDVTMAASLAMLAISFLRRRKATAFGATAPQFGATFRTRASLRPELIFAAVVCWAVLLWLVHGHKVDEITKTDVRVVGLALAMFVIARTCTVATFADLSSAIAGLGPALSAKALAIYLSGLWVIGSNDRLQTSVDYIDGHKRIILIGGDTILILIPAVAVHALMRSRSTTVRLTLWFCALSGFIGLVLSGTRSGIIVAVVMLGVVALVGRSDFRWPSIRTASVGLLIVALLIGGLIANGTEHRFVTPDSPHVGINFRIDELRSLRRLPASDILLGQGIGGRFIGKDVNGRLVTTGWSHTFPAWIVLKIGVIGLIVVSLFAIGEMWRRVGYIREAWPLRADAALGCVLLLGVLLMSLSLGRAALPEGSIVLGLAFALLGRGARA